MDNQAVDSMGKDVASRDIMRVSILEWSSSSKTLHLVLVEHVIIGFKAKVKVSWLWQICFVEHGMQH